jgi:hypothetical protein
MKRGRRKQADGAEEMLSADGAEEMLSADGAEDAEKKGPPGGGPLFTGKGER